MLVPASIRLAHAARRAGGFGADADEAIDSAT
jgi:hypothetical protein